VKWNSVGAVPSVLRPLAPGLKRSDVAQLGALGPAAAGGDGGRAEMIAEQEPERASRAHCHALPACVVVRGHGVGAASCALYGHPLEVVADVSHVGRAPYLHLHPMVVDIRHSLRFQIHIHIGRDSLICNLFIAVNIPHQYYPNRNLTVQFGKDGIYTCRTLQIRLPI
jgi:hypothetical protein